MPHCIVRRAELHVFAVDVDRARVRLVDAEHQPRGFSAARPEQSRETEYLPRLHVEIDGIHHATPRDTLHRQKRRRTRALLLRIGRAAFEALRHPVMADHLRDELFDGQIFREIFALAFAVAHHGNAVGNRVRLFEKVRDEQDRDARLPDVA
ncbi:hypothetical protein PPGU19_041030 [Paraburkholderia sp. PGU19]|nr:hypothetical protein PPGU19_041030 [Paraburkholderia sp. PGU19]